MPSLGGPDVMMIPLQDVGLVAGLCYIAVAVLLSSRPVLAKYLPFVSHARYKARVPFAFFSLGAGIVLTVWNVYIVGIVDASQATLVGYLLMIFGAFLGGWICWLILPTSRPDLLEDDELPEE